MVPRSIQGLGRCQVTQVKPAVGTHCHHQVLGEIGSGEMDWEGSLDTTDHQNTEVKGEAFNFLLTSTLSQGSIEVRPWSHTEVSRSPRVLTFPLLHTSPTPTQVSCKRIKRGSVRHRGRSVFPNLCKAQRSGVF